MAKTTRTRNITAKQKKVLKALDKGKSVPQIAKSMRIGETGVYAHIRRLKELGVLNGEGKPVSSANSSERAAAEPEPSSVNASPGMDANRMVSELVDKTLQIIAAREKEIADRLNGIQREQEELDTEAKQLKAESESLTGQKDYLSKRP